MLSATVTATPSEITVRITGSAETDLLDHVSETLRTAHQEAVSGHKRVVIDLRELEFASSSCLKVLGSWLVAATELGEPYHVMFRACTRHAWQQRSVPALVALAPEIVTVDNVP